MTKKSDSSFLVQGSILAIAGVLVRVIGMIYRIPLTNGLGNTANAYYTSAYDIYSILLLLSSQSIPLAVSKLVSERLARGEYKSAHHFFKGAMWYAVVTGVFMGMIAIFGANFFSNIIQRQGMADSVRVLGFTIIIVSIMGVFRGYFQGMGKMEPTAISQIIEQIINAIVSVGAAYYLRSYGKALAHSTAEEQKFNSDRLAAMGGTLGTCFGAMFGLIVLLYLYKKMSRSLRKNIRKDKVSRRVSNSDVMKSIILTITPIIVSSTVFQLGNVLDNFVFAGIQNKILGMDSGNVTDLWGVYSGKYKILTTMPIAIAAALTLSIVPTIVESYAQRDRKTIKKKIDMAIRFTMIIAFPCGVGLSVLGGPVCILLFPSTGYVEISTKLMFISVFTVVPYCLSTITNSILQGIDKLRIPLNNATISLVVHFIILYILLVPMKLSVYGVAIGDSIFAAVICYLNARALRKYIGYRQDIMSTMIKPGISSAVMGVAAYLVFYLVKNGLAKLGAGIIVSNDIGTILGILVAIPIYFIVLIKINGLDEDVIASLPIGEKMRNVLRRI